MGDMMYFGLQGKSYSVNMICNHSCHLINKVGPLRILYHACADYNIWDRFHEKGPNAYIIKFPVRAIRNVTYALKCMSN